MAEEDRFANIAEPDISDIVRGRLEEIRRHLPHACQTAAAIDRNAPWAEIAETAQRDGLHEIASLIFEAEQEGLED
jgi:hypothetical protein